MAGYLGKQYVFTVSTASITFQQKAASGWFSLNEPFVLPSYAEWHLSNPSLCHNLDNPLKF